MLFVLKFKLNVSVRTSRVFRVLVMSKNSEKVFYAVGRGKETGIFDTWKECKERTEGIHNAKFRKFYSYEDAEEFVNFWKNYSTPVKENLLSENIVSKTGNISRSVAIDRQQACEEVCFVTDTPCQKSEKNKVGNNVLGQGTATLQLLHCKGERSFCMLPYTSPLSTTLNHDFISALSSKTKRQPKVLSEAVKPKNSTNEIKRFSQDDLKTLDCNFALDCVPSIKQGTSLKKKLNESFQKPLSSSSPSLNNSSDSTNVVNISKTTVTSAENITLSSSSASEKKSSEPCSEIPRDSYKGEDVSNVEKEKHLKINFDYQSDKVLNTGQISEVGEMLISCLNTLVSVFEIVTKQNTHVGKKIKKFLRTLQQHTNNDTNTNVNPQMEPEENVQMNCEDTKNVEVQLLGTQPAATQGEASLEAQSSRVPCVQSSLSQLSSVEGRLDQKNADIIALNLRLDSFERRFDTCLKEIGAIVAEISRLKSDVKDIKETLNSTSKKGSTSSPDKSKDGKVQTLLCFDSSGARNTSARFSSDRVSEACSEESGTKERRNLKRKLSRSGSFEKSKRSADNDIDDILLRIKTEKVDYTSFTLDENDYVEVYTDGSALSNGKGGSKAGIGVWFGDNHPLNVAEPVVGPPTNNTAEIQAARVAVQLAVNAGITKLKIFTDSEFLINCATKWIHRWEKNGWTLRDGGPVKNRKELEKLQKASSKISVRWEKVAAHSNIKGNEAADRLANEGALKYE